MTLSLQYVFDHCNTFLQLETLGFEPAQRSLRKRSFAQSETGCLPAATHRHNFRECALAT